MSATAIGLGKGKAVRDTSQELKLQEAKIQETVRGKRTSSAIIKTRRSGTQQLIKIGNLTCKQNAIRAGQYFFNKPMCIAAAERQSCFFMLRFSLQELVDCICALLNQNGGVLYYGVNEKGVVKGLTLSRRTIDELQVNLDIALRNFAPRIPNDQVKLDFEEICLDSRAKCLLANAYVLRVEVYPSHQQCFYVTNDLRFALFKNRKLTVLYPIELVRHVQSKYRPKLAPEFFMQRWSPLALQKMDHAET